MENLPQQKLRELYVTYGRALCDDYQRCEALLRDLCGPYMRDQSTAFKREIHLLIEALKDGAPVELLTLPPGVPREARLAVLTQRLRANTGLSLEAARWAIDSWAQAMGLVFAGRAANANQTAASDPQSERSSERSSQVVRADSSTARTGPRVAPDTPVSQRYARSNGSSVEVPARKSATGSTAFDSSAGAQRAASKSIDPSTAKPYPPTSAGRKFAVPEWLIMVIAFTIAALAFSYLYLNSHPSSQHYGMSQPPPVSQPVASSSGVSPQIPPSDAVVTRSGVPPPPALGSWKSSASAPDSATRDSAPPMGAH
jgi:hypothetical protein